MTVTVVNVQTGEKTTRPYTAQEQADIAARVAAEDAARVIRDANDENFDKVPLAVKALGLALVNKGVWTVAEARQLFKDAVKQLR